MRETPEMRLRFSQVCVAAAADRFMFTFKSVLCSTCDAPVALLHGDSVQMCAAFRL